MRSLHTTRVSQLGAGSGYGPPSLMHAWLSRCFGGIGVRATREGPWLRFHVESRRRNEYGLAIEASLVEDCTERELRRILQELDVCEEMKRRRGCCIRVRRDGDKIVLSVSGGARR